MPREITRVMAPYKSIEIEKGFNSRKNMKDLPGLAARIKARGLVQAIVVREGGPDKDGNRRFFLVAGERRYRAVGLLGWSQVEVKLIKGNAEELALVNLTENLDREDLDPLEEAEAFVALMKRFHWSQAELAKKIGRSEPFVSQRLALLKKTIPEVKAKLQDGTLTATQARELVTLPEEEQRELVQHIETRKQGGHNVGVEEVREEVERRREKTKAKHDPNEAEKLERVRQVRERYGDADLSVRPKRDLLDQVGILQTRLQRASSTKTREMMKHQISALEWVIGVRESL